MLARFLFAVKKLLHFNPAHDNSPKIHPCKPFAKGAPEIEIPSEHDKMLAIRQSQMIAKKLHFFPCLEILAGAATVSEDASMLVAMFGCQHGARKSSTTVNKQASVGQTAYPGICSETAASASFQSICQFPKELTC